MNSPPRSGRRRGAGPPRQRQGSPRRLPICACDLPPAPILRASGSRLSSPPALRPPPGLLACRARRCRLPAVRGSGCVSSSCSALGPSSGVGGGSGMGTGSGIGGGSGLGRGSGAGAGSGSGEPGRGSGTTGVAGSIGVGTVAGLSGAPGVPGSGSIGVTGASGTTGVGGSVGVGTSRPGIVAPAAA
jgi:hypothetical protein